MNLPVRVRAPATTANLGPGFDCVGVALNLWNELEVSEGEGVGVEGEGAEEIASDESHLGVRAFSLLGSNERKRFCFTNRIPLARGLGSSAATIALGLVAATLVEGDRPEPEVLVNQALELEEHADNLAAVFSGGVCFTWRSGGVQRVAQIAKRLPLVPIAVIPDVRVETVAARAALPRQVSHEDAAFTVGRAALLGAGLAGGPVELFADAFHDRLHEPYRAGLAPLLGAVRERLPAGSVGATLSGSGPTVIVWAREDAHASTIRELEEQFPKTRILPLDVSPVGTGS